MHFTAFSLRAFVRSVFACCRAVHRRGSNSVRRGGAGRKFLGFERCFRCGLDDGLSVAGFHHAHAPTLARARDGRSRIAVRRGRGDAFVLSFATGFFAEHAVQEQSAFPEKH